ncbi:MAG: ornithine carbamoyltransferase [Clostridia bacterium]|nr:ornithine carbamoyltransferase [Clostridia bacterium]
MDINRYSPTYKVNKIHMTKLTGYTSEEIFELLYAVKAMKAKFNAHEETKILTGVTVALLFNDTSLRTRSALEIGARQLGAECVNLPYSEKDMRAGENVKDILSVITRYGVGALVTRGIAQPDLDAFMEVSTIPIINSTNDDFVPMEVICDLFTIWEKKRKLEGLKLAYVGKGTNTAATLIMGAIKCGMEVTVSIPNEYPIKCEHLETAEQYGKINMVADPVAAVKDADIVYTDGYSYHDVITKEELAILKPYQVTKSLMANAKADAFFMHPLPATRGVEVTAEVIDGKNSIVYEQAENRLHTVKAVLALLVR